LTKKYKPRAACEVFGTIQLSKIRTLNRVSSDPYEISTSPYDIHAIANVERHVPAEWITGTGDGLNEKYLEYARPLIMGELQPLFVDGLPRHLVMKELFD
jgi:6-phosphofructokinase 1